MVVLHFIIYFTTVLWWDATKLSFFITTMYIVIVGLLILLMSHCLFRCVSLNRRGRVVKALGSLSTRCRFETYFRHSVLSLG